MTSKQILRKLCEERDSSHHKNQEGYESGQIDVISENRDAIRGREHLLIIELRKLGVCGNTNNGISNRNVKMQQYLQAAQELFGETALTQEQINILLSFFTENN